jgi:hypothetical protein
VSLEFGATKQLPGAKRRDGLVAPGNPTMGFADRVMMRARLRTHILVLPQFGAAADFLSARAG